MALRAKNRPKINHHRSFHPHAGITALLASGTAKRGRPPPVTQAQGIRDSRANLGKLDLAALNPFAWLLERRRNSKLFRNRNSDVRPLPVNEPQRIAIQPL